MISKTRLLAAALAVALSPLGERAAAQASSGAPSPGTPSRGSGGSPSLGQRLESDAAKAAGLGGGSAGSLASVLGWLHGSNTSAIRAGKLAQQKSSSSAVKDLASKVVSDRSGIDQEISRVASAAGVSLPSAGAKASGAVGTAGAAGLAALQKLQGKSFDQGFLKWIGQHGQRDASQAKSRQASAQQSGNTALASLLGKVAPQLQSHADAAQQLAQWSGAGGGTSTGSGQ